MGGEAVLSWNGADPGQTLQSLLQASSRLLQPESGDSASLYVGSLLSQMLQVMPGRVSDCGSHCLRCQSHLPVAACPPAAGEVQVRLPALFRMPQQTSASHHVVGHLEPHDLVLPVCCTLWAAGQHPCLCPAA